MMIMMAITELSTAVNIPEEMSILSILVIGLEINRSRKVQQICDRP